MPPKDTSRAPQHLTRFRARYLPGRAHDRLLFGAACRYSRRAGQGGEVLQSYHFPPGARFAIDLRRYGRDGTIVQQSLVCEALNAHEHGVRLPVFDRDVRVLLHARSVSESLRFLRWLLYITSAGLDPQTCPAALFQATQSRLRRPRARATAAEALQGRRA